MVSHMRIVSPSGSVSSETSNGGLVARRAARESRSRPWLSGARSVGPVSGGLAMPSHSVKATGAPSPVSAAGSLGASLVSAVRRPLGSLLPVRVKKPEVRDGVAAGRVGSVCGPGLVSSSRAASGAPAQAVPSYLPVLSRRVAACGAGTGAYIGKQPPVSAAPSAGSRSGFVGCAASSRVPVLAPSSSAPVASLARPLLRSCLKKVSRYGGSSAVEAGGSVPSVVAMRSQGVRFMSRVAIRYVSYWGCAGSANSCCGKHECRTCPDDRPSSWPGGNLVPGPAWLAMQAELRIAAVVDSLLRL